LILSIIGPCKLPAKVKWCTPCAKSPNYWDIWESGGEVLNVLNLYTRWRGMVSFRSWKICSWRKIQSINMKILWSSFNFVKKQANSNSIWYNYFSLMFPQWCNISKYNNLGHINFHRQQIYKLNVASQKPIRSKLSLLLHCVNCLWIKPVQLTSIHNKSGHVNYTFKGSALIFLTWKVPSSWFRG
jgi:hypothetical protein